MDPRAFEKLCEILVNAQFQYDELDALIMQCTGEYRMDWVANRSNPPAKIVKEGLKYAERNGIANKFLAFALLARKGDRNFRELMLQCMPELEDFTPSAHPPVDPLLAGLRRARDLTVDPSVRQALLNMQDSISAFRKAVRRLKAFKALHDNLHTVLQIRPANLDDLLAGIRTDQNSYNDLSDYLDVIGTRRANAQIECERLRDPEAPAGGEDFTRERNWIDQLARILEDYRTSLHARQQGKVRFAIRSIVILAANHLSQLNLAIVAISQNLRLDEIGSAMLVARDAMAEARQEDAEILAAAGQAAMDLLTFLRVHVSRHNEYQLANDELETLSLEIHLPPEILFESEFVETWQPIKGRLHRLAAIRTEGYEHWQTELEECVQLVDEALEHLVNAFSVGPQSEAVLMSASEAAALLRTSIVRCRSKCFTQFFYIDLALMQECEKLSQLEHPIEELLDRL